MLRPVARASQRATLRQSLSALPTPGTRAVHSALRSSSSRAHARTCGCASSHVAPLQVWSGCGASSSHRRPVHTWTPAMSRSPGSLAGAPVASALSSDDDEEFTTPAGLVHSAKDLSNQDGMLAPELYKFYRHELLRQPLPMPKTVRKTLRAIQHLGGEPTSSLFVAVLAKLAHVTRPRVDIAFQVFEEMLKVNPDTGEPQYPDAPLTTEAITALVQVCLRSKQPKPDHALKAFKYSVMRDEAGRLKFPDAAPDNLALSALFAAMVLRKRGPTIADVNACIELYEMMSEVDEEGNRLFPDVELTDTELFNSLLFIIVKRRLPNDETNKNSVDFRQAKAVFDRAVREYGVKPNLISYNSMIVAASRAVGGADLDAAVELFHETLKFNADGTPKAGDLPDTFTFNNLLAACARARTGPDLGQASLVFREMKRVDPVGNPRYPNAKPDTITYNSLLNCCAKVKPSELKTALQLFKRMRADQVQPDTVTFNSLLSCCCTPPGKGSDAKTAISVFEEMFRVTRSTGERVYSNIDPDTQTFNYIIRAVSTRSPDNGGPHVPSVMKLVRDMVSTHPNGKPVYPRAVPNLVTWGVALSACASAQPPCVDDAFALVEIARKHNQRLTPRIVNYVLQACSNANPVRLADGISILEQSQREQCRSNAFTLLFALRLFGKCEPEMRSTDLAEEWLRALVHNGSLIKPSSRYWAEEVFGHERATELMDWAEKTLTDVVGVRSATIPDDMDEDGDDGFVRYDFK